MAKIYTDVIKYFVSSPVKGKKVYPSLAVSEEYLPVTC